MVFVIVQYWQKLAELHHGVGYSDTFDETRRWKPRQQPRRQSRVQHDEHAAVVGTPDQAAIGLLERSRASMSS